MNFLSVIREFVYYLTYPFRMLARLPSSIISAPGRFWGMTLPTRVAVLVAVSLLVVSILYFIIKAFDPDAPERWEYVGHALVVIVLIVVIAIVTRIAVKTWLEKDYSRFPEIDEAWTAGMDALRAQGIDLLDTPIYLVLGAGSREEADTLLHATGLTLSVDGQPFDKGWLHWYANANAIYLVFTHTCRLAALKGKLAESDDKLDHGSDLIRQTIGPEPSVRGTAEAARPEPPTSRHPLISANPEDSQSSSVRGTIMVSGNQGGSPLHMKIGSSRRNLSLTIDEGAEFTSRLEYVCHRLRRERQPVCPCNGVLTLLPFEIIKRGEAEGIEVQRAVKADLEVIRDVLALRCPVTVLVGGMERESGFRELVRRVGRKRAKGQRFGHRFSVWNSPIPDQIHALAAHACKAFEDFTYMLFQEKDGLTHIGNRKLYSLLCCVRSTLRIRLTNILAGAYGDDSSDIYGSGESLLFSGCYFGATGDVEDRQAFVSAVVFDRLDEIKEELDWSERALKEDRRFHVIAQAALVVDGLLFFAAIALVFLLWQN